MRISKCVQCDKFPCSDVRHESCIVPAIDLKPETVSLVMISEAAPADKRDYFYAKGKPIFEQTSLQAFSDAGIEASSIEQLVNRGIYFTTAVKCAKTGYAIQPGTIRQCSFLLERELALFPNLKTVMLMGDVAIKALNHIAKRAGEPRVIPSGSTYRLRGKRYSFRGMRIFPSYLQAGPSFFIEKSKRRMIAEDISEAVKGLER